MTIEEVIAMVEHRGMRFEVSGDRLRIRGEVQNMTPPLHRLVNAYNTQLWRHYGLSYNDLPDPCPMCGGRIEQ